MDSPIILPSSCGKFITKKKAVMKTSIKDKLLINCVLDIAMPVAHERVYASQICITQHPINQDDDVQIE